MDKRETILSEICRVGRRRRLVIGGWMLPLGERNISRTEEKIKRTMSEWVGLRGYCDNEQDLDHLAAKADASIEELREFIGRRLNERFLTLRKELRIADAAELILKHPQLPLAEVGKMVGINDKSDFRREFRSIYGCTPKEWRDSASNTCRVRE